MGEVGISYSYIMMIWGRRIAVVERGTILTIISAEVVIIVIMVGIGTVVRIIYIL